MIYKFFLIIPVILLTIAAWIDLKEYRVPDSLAGVGCAAFMIVGPFAGLTVLTVVLRCLLCTAMTGVLVCVALAAEAVLKKQVMGGGDIKLIFMAGLFFTWQDDLLAVFSACLAALIFLLISGRKKTSGNGHFPLAPFLAFGWIFMAILRTTGV